MPEMMDFRGFVENWADQAESFHQKKDSKFSTLEGIMMKHPDLLEGGWGWNRLMPRFGNLDWSVYKSYLEQYYLRNCAESVAQGDELCVLCDSGLEENIDHLFFECPFAGQCWNSINFTWDTSLPLMERLAMANSIHNLEFFTEATIIAAWELWKLRNDKIFQRSCRPLLFVFCIKKKNGSVAEACRDKQEAYVKGIGDSSVVASLASLCVKMEKQFISECNKWGFGDNAADHIILSKDIQERALSLKNMGDKFPVAAAALMFITKKAELMCEWLRRGAFTPESMVTAVRRCALNLMMYRGSEYDCAAALMVGIAKETKTLFDCLGKDDPAVNLSVTVMKNGWESLKMLHDEFLPAGNDDGKDGSLEEYFAQLSKAEAAGGEDPEGAVERGSGTAAQAITLASSQDHEGAGEIAAGEDTAVKIMKQIKTESEHMIHRLRQGHVPRQELIASFQKILHLSAMDGKGSWRVTVKNEDKNMDFCR